MANRVLEFRAKKKKKKTLIQVNCDFGILLLLVFFYVSKRYSSPHQSRMIFNVVSNEHKIVYKMDEWCE